MKTKLMTLIAVLAIAIGSLGVGAAGAQPGCPESAGCQPIGDRPSQKPRANAGSARLTPRSVDSNGQLWRAGNHLMY